MLHFNLFLDGLGHDETVIGSGLLPAAMYLHESLLWGHVSLTVTVLLASTLALSGKLTPTSFAVVLMQLVAAVVRICVTHHKHSFKLL